MESASVDVGVYYVRTYDIQLLEQLSGESRAKSLNNAFKRHHPKSQVTMATQSACRLDDIMEQLEDQGLEVGCREDYELRSAFTRVWLFWHRYCYTCLC